MRASNAARSSEPLAVNAAIQTDSGPRIWSNSASRSASSTGRSETPDTPGLHVICRVTPQRNTLTSQQGTWDKTVISAAIEDVHLQCGRELCALARVNMNGTQEPSRSSDDGLPRAVVVSPPAGGSGSA